MNKHPFEDLEVKTVIAIRHGKPENGRVRAILSDDGEHQVNELASLIKKHLTKDGEGVIIFHSHEVRAFHTAFTMARKINHRTTLTVGRLDLGRGNYNEGRHIMESMVSILSNFPGIKVIIFIGHDMSMPGVINAFSVAMEGPIVGCFESGYCGGAMIDLETGETIVGLMPHFTKLEEATA